MFIIIIKFSNIVKKKKHENMNAFLKVKIKFKLKDNNIYE
jgi:hypothetical protein